MNEQSIQFNLASAQSYADDDKLEDWIHTYLNTGDWQNKALSDGLKLAQRWWTAPVKMSLDRLTRCCGPEKGMPYRVPQESWEKRVNTIKETLNDIADLPPLIVECQDTSYFVRDGNHRYEAISRKGWSHCWVIIWYNKREEWQQDSF